MRVRTRLRFLQVALACVALTAVAFLFLDGSDAIVLLRFGLSIMTLALFGIWFCTTPTSPYRAPDILRERFKGQSIIESDGLCTFVCFEVKDGLCWLRVYY